VLVAFVVLTVISMATPGGHAMVLGSLRAA